MLRLHVVDWYHEQCAVNGVEGNVPVTFVVFYVDELGKTTNNHSG